MATEEVNKPQSLSDMIVAAIEGMNDKNGSSKAAIAKYIETTYGNQPDSTVLTENLNQMKDNGELIMSKNNYMRPSNPTTPASSAKRGRGRPPKPKSANSGAASDVVVGPPRPRGRPPKQRDPLSVVATPPKSSGRGRGRPPKKDSPSPASAEVEKEVEKEPEAAVDMTTTTTVVTGTGTPKGRGRPPKAKPQVAAVGV